MGIKRSQANGLLGCLAGFLMILLYIVLFAIGLALAAGFYWLLGMGVVYLAGYFLDKQYEVLPCAVLMFFVTFVLGMIFRGNRSSR